MISLMVQRLFIYNTKTLCDERDSLSDEGHGAMFYWSRPSQEEDVEAGFNILNFESHVCNFLMCW